MKINPQNKGLQVTLLRSGHDPRRDEKPMLTILFWLLVLAAFIAPLWIINEAENKSIGFVHSLVVCLSIGILSAACEEAINPGDMGISFCCAMGLPFGVVYCGFWSVVSWVATRFNKNESEPTVKSPKKYRKTIALVSIALIGVLWPSSPQTDYGLGVDSVEWLPSQAQNISYFSTRIDRVAEFEIEQAVFEKWCENRDMPLQVLPQGFDRGASKRYYNIARCWRHLELGGHVSDPPEEQYGERDSKEFNAGDLYYEDSWLNGGGYQLGYDIEEGMGYFWYAHH